MNEHWYLRHGDFHPEKLQPGETLGYPNAQITLEQLSEAGNLFDNEDDAIEASILVRSHLARFKFIRQELQGYTRRNGKRSGNNQPSSPSSGRQENSDEESQSGCDEPQQPNGQSASHQRDESSRVNDRGSHLTILFLT